MSAIGKTISNMALEEKFGKMGVLTMDSTIKPARKAKENTYGTMEIVLLVSGTTIC